MSSSGPNSLGGLLSNPAILSAMYPNLNLSALAQLYTSEQTAMEQPIQNLSQQLQTITSQSTAWQAIQSAVSALQSDFSSLSSASTWQTAAATSSQSTAVAASTGSGATPGTYLVAVTQVGQPEVVSSQSSYASASTALNLQAQTVTLGSGSSSGSISITSQDTLDTIAQKINAAGAGVYATVIDSGGSYYLSLSSTQDASITGSGTDLFGTTSQGLALNLSSPAQSALPWLYTVNGVSVTGTQATDSTSIPGVTLTLLGLTTTNTPATISVTSSSSGAESALSQVASDYNNLTATIAKYTAKGQVLAGDATAEGLLSTVNSALFGLDQNQPVGFQSVTDVGLTLTLNPDKTTTLNFTPGTFLSTYAQNPTDVQNLVAGASGGSGIAGNLNTVLTAYTAPTTGTIAQVLNGYQQQIQQIDQSEQNEQSLITLQQSALGTQFTNEINALISLLGQQSMVSGLINQLNGTSSSSSSSSSSSGG